jgi:hypothetical protein
MALAFVRRAFLQFLVMKTLYTAVVELSFTSTQRDYPESIQKHFEASVVPAFSAEILASYCSEDSRVVDGEGKAWDTYYSYTLRVRLKSICPQSLHALIGVFQHCSLLFGGGSFRIMQMSQSEVE